MPRYRRFDQQNNEVATTVTPLISPLPRKTRAVFILFIAAYIIGGLVCLVCGGFVMMAFQTEAMMTANNWITSYGVLHNQTIMICAQMLTAAGVFSLVIAIYGFAYARNRHGAAIAFTLLLGSTMFFQWMAAYAAFEADQSVSDNVKNGMFRLENMTDGNSNDSVAYRPTSLFVNIQRDWKCCGVVNSTEWLRQVAWFQDKYLNISIVNPNKLVVLDGCCSEKAKCQNCSAAYNMASECTLASPDAVFPKGCADEIATYLHRFLSLVCTVASVFGAVQVLGLLVSVNLAASFSDAVER